MRALVSAEYDRLRREHGKLSADAVAVLGEALADAVSDVKPVDTAGKRHSSMGADGKMAWTSVQHLLNGHHVVRCHCASGENHEADGRVCSTVPETWVLAGFEEAASRFPIADPALLKVTAPSGRQWKPTDTLA